MTFITVTYHWLVFVDSRKKMIFEILFETNGNFYSLSRAILAVFRILEREFIFHSKKGHCVSRKFQRDRARFFLSYYFFTTLSTFNFISSTWSRLIQSPRKEIPDCPACTWAFYLYPNAILIVMLKPLKIHSSLNDLITTLTSFESIIEKNRRYSFRWWWCFQSMIHSLTTQIWILCMDSMSMVCTGRV